MIVRFFGPAWKAEPSSEVQFQRSTPKGYKAGKMEKVCLKFVDVCPTHHSKSNFPHGMVQRVLQATLSKATTLPFNQGRNNARRDLFNVCDLKSPKACSHKDSGFRRFRLPNVHSRHRSTKIPEIPSSCTNTHNP